MPDAFDILFILWCAIGAGGFFAARAAWHLEFEPRPMRRGDLIFLIFAMIFAPVALFVAALNFLLWFTGQDRHSRVQWRPMQRIRRYLAEPL